MSQNRVLILDLCLDGISERVCSIIESNIHCEVNVLQDRSALAQFVKQWPPDLIFWIAEEFAHTTDLIPAYEDIPAISLFSHHDSDKPTLEPFPEQIDDIIISPFKEAELIWKTKRLLDLSAVAQAGRLSREQKHRAKENIFILQHLGLKNLIGRDPAFLELVRKIPLIADCDATIVICGETGVGKELFARAIHYLSSRSKKPFIPVHSGHVDRKELFGHRKGAYTDARNNQPGLIAEAEGGTLFLDEIEALSMEAQSTLLRLLQDKSYRPLGQTGFTKSNIRFIVATNEDLQRKIKAGRFRSDLYYRFTLTLNLPPLRQRKQDIMVLAQHFLRKYSREHDRGPKSLSRAAMEKLLQYDWPGNIRELENIIQQAIVFTPGSLILPESINLPALIASYCNGPLSFKRAKQKAPAEFERAYVTELLIRFGGNITHAAKLAQKDRSDFGRLVHKHQIDRNAFTSCGRLTAES